MDIVILLDPYLLEYILKYLQERLYIYRVYTQIATQQETPPQGEFLSTAVRIVFPLPTS